MNSTVCDYNQIATRARNAAAAAGANLSAYNRYVYAFPQNACTWWGLGTVGGNPSQAWINGSLQLRVAAHEIGHNFGLYHSHSLDCGSAAVGGSCTSSDYGDTLDTMGSSAHHFNAFQKERLGWLGYGSSPPITTVEAGGTYTLDAYESVGSNPKALKVLKSTDASGRPTYYYAECCRPIGFDASLSSNANVLNGYVIHLGTESSGDSSYLLDMTPATSSWNDPALVVGQTFDDLEAGVFLAPVAACNSLGTISVNFAPTPCVRANPDISLSPAQSQWTTPGGSVTYTVSVVNKDNPSCDAANFNLAALVPSGWSAVVNHAYRQPGRNGFRHAWADRA